MTKFFSTPLAAILLLASLLATLLAGTAAVASDLTTGELTATEAASAYASETTYSIFRKGKKIGSHLLEIQSVDGDIDVNIVSQITIRILKIPVFRFRYESKEQWENDKLISVASTTKTNKDLESASLENTDGESLLTNDAGQRTSALIPHATNHWNINAVHQNNLFNTVKGINSKVSVTTVEDEVLTINGKSIKATQYQYTGDLVVQSWYDENQRWVKLAFLGTDGSAITYLIDNP